MAEIKGIQDNCFISVWQCIIIFLFTSLTKNETASPLPLNHSAEEFVQLFFTITEVTAFNVVSRLLAPATGWCVQLLRNEKRKNKILCHDLWTVFHSFPVDQFHKLKLPKDILRIV